MDNATLLIIAIAVVTVMVWYYEYRTVQLERQLADLLAYLEDREDRDAVPPFNLVETDPVYADAFKLTDVSRCNATNGDLVCTLAPHDTPRHMDESRGNAHHSATFFTRDEIEAWN